MSRDYKKMMRREWSEFSLRARPLRTMHFQAGKDNSCLSVKHFDAVTNDISWKIDSTNLSFEEDSIQYDAYIILMSYPEGRQRLLERAAALKSEKSRVRSKKSAVYSEKHDRVVDKLGEQVDISDGVFGVKDKHDASDMKTYNEFRKLKNKTSFKKKTRRFGTRRSRRLEELSNRKTTNRQSKETEDSSKYEYMVSKDVKKEDFNSIGGSNKETEGKQTEFSLNEELDGGQPDSEILPYGSLLWAKIGKRWWPSIKISGPMAGQSEAGHAHLWVMWFGDYKITRVKQCHAVRFGRYFKQHYNERLSKLHESAVVEALKVCVDRCGLHIDGYNEIKEWGRLDSGLDYYVESCDIKKDPFLPIRGSEFPPSIMDVLERLPCQDETDTGDELHWGCYRRELVAFGEHDILEQDFEVTDQEFCLSCARKRVDIVCQHPLFEGSVCGRCKESLWESLLAIDDDGYYVYCTVCGDGGYSFLCEEADCGRSYCASCLNRYLTHDSFEEVRATSAWKCLLCSMYSEDTHGLLIPRQAWKDQLVAFYNPTSTPIYLQEYLPFLGRRLRVLSIYDGIGAVRVALEGLFLDIDRYFTLESDPYANRITSYKNMVDGTVQNMSDINNEWIEAIYPIDLVVVNLPCEDLDVTNPDDQSVYGPESNVFKILTIIKLMESVHESKGDYPFYWIIEGSARMKSKARNMITDFMKVKPTMWDPQFLSPYICPKLYWGNIPWIDSAVQSYSENKDRKRILKKYLKRKHGRKAKVTALRNTAIDFADSRTKGSIETRVNGYDPGDEALIHFAEDYYEEEDLIDSLENFRVLYERMTEYRNDSDIDDGSLYKKNTGKETMYTLPVLMKNKDSVIWVNEVERILGFPSHYTDCPMVDIPQRKKLLKKTTSVKIWKEILEPIMHMFVT